LNSEIIPVQTSDNFNVSFFKPLQSLQKSLLALLQVKFLCEDEVTTYFSEAVNTAFG